MNARTQITLERDIQRRAQAKASELGISFAEYVRRLLAQDLRGPGRKADVSLVFDTVHEGAPTNIASDKDKMLAEAVWQERRRRGTRKRKLGGKLKLSRR